MRYTNDARVEECELMHVKILLSPADGEPAKPTPIQAAAVINDWAATPWNGDPDAKRFVVTHVPSGKRVGPDMTMRDAQRTAAKLGREPSLQNLDESVFAANRDTLIPLTISCFPKHTKQYWALFTPKS